MPFNLKSNFKPEGDQPQAIKKLTEGLRRGEKFQTLLGVTGSGKSLHPNEDVWIYREVDEKLTPELVTIGAFVDRILQEQNLSETQNEAQVVFLSSKLNRYYAFSINPKTLKAVSKAVWEIVEKGGAPEEDGSTDDNVPPPIEE